MLGERCEGAVREQRVLYSISDNNHPSSLLLSAVCVDERVLKLRKVAFYLSEQQPFTMFTGGNR